jgi:hypothetical protein
MGELYQNRAVALVDLARRDLQHYLQLEPHAEDCLEVEHQLAELDGGRVAA